MTNRKVENLSIIVPVYNGSKFVSSFFDSFLDALVGISKQVELIIVDNGSKDNTSNLLLEYSNKISFIKYYYYNEKKGSYSARNFGVNKASFEYIFFTDIDCIFSSNFFNKIFNLDVCNDSFYGGMVKIWIEDKGNPWEILDSGSHMRNEQLLFATANMFVKKSLFDVVGIFSETTSGGDHAWSKKAKSKGLKSVYLKDLIVSHPPRKNYCEFKKKYLRIAYGDAINRYRIGYVSYMLGLARFLVKLPLLPRCTNKFDGIELKRYILFRLCFFKLRINQLIVYLKTPFYELNKNPYR